MLRRRFVQSLPLIPMMAAARTRHVHLAIWAGVYSAHPIAEAARRIKEAGFEGAQLSLIFDSVRSKIAVTH